MMEAPQYSSDQNVNDGARGVPSGVPSGGASAPVAEPTWEESARAMQQDFYEQLGDSDWCSYKASELDYLHRNIGFALFGPPSQEPNSENSNTGYSKEQLEEIKDICETIKNKDDHKLSISRNLYKSIGNLIFGASNVSPSIINEMSGYSQEKLKHVKKVLELIKSDRKRNVYPLQIQLEQYVSNIENVCLKQSISDICESIQIMVAMEENNTWLSIVFVIMKVECKGDSILVPEAVFRVPLEATNGIESHVFIDRNKRVYEGWAKYLKNNKLPACTYCYPTGGIYMGNAEDTVLLEYAETPASSTGNKVLDVVDKAGIAVSVGSTLVFGAALVTIPVAAPLLVGAAVCSGIVGFWGIGRGVEQLVDRGTHEQTVSLTDSDARNTWISIGASTLGLAAAGATSTVAALTRGGVVIGETAQLAVNIAQISSLAVNGIGIVNGAFHLHEKYQSDTLTGLDVFQFTSSVLFFAHSAATTRMANTIIRETQTTVIEDYRSNLRSNKHRKAFDRVARNTRGGDGGVQGNAKVIKGINNINNPDDFFSGVVRLQKHHKADAAKLTLTDAGNVNINGRLTVNPSTLADIPKADRIKLFDASKQFNDGKLTKVQFDKIVTNMYAPEIPTSFASSSKTLPAISDFFKSNNISEIDATRSTVFAFLSSVEWDRWKLLAKKNLAPLILPLAIDLYERLYNRVTPAFVEFVEFSYNKIMSMIDDFEIAYQEALLAASNNADFNQRSFDSVYGIVGDRANHFVSCVRCIFSLINKLDDLKTEYTRYHQTQAHTSHTDENSGEINNHHRRRQESSAVIPPDSSSSDMIDLTDHPVRDASPMQSPPAPRPSGSRLRPTMMSYPWDFAVDGIPTDEDIYAMANDLTRLEVNHSTAHIQRAYGKCMVVFQGCDTVVMVMIEEVNQLVTAKVIHDN